MYKKGGACYEVHAISNASSLVADCGKREEGVRRRPRGYSSEGWKCKGVASCIDCEKVTRAVIMRPVKIHLATRKPRGEPPNRTCMSRTSREVKNASWRSLPRMGREIVVESIMNLL